MREASLQEKIIKVNVREQTKRLEIIEQGFAVAHWLSSVNSAGPADKTCATKGRQPFYFALEQLLNQVKFNTCRLFMRRHPPTPPTCSPFHICQSVSRRARKDSGTASSQAKARLVQGSDRQRLAFQMSAWMSAPANASMHTIYPTLIPAHAHGDFSRCSQPSKKSTLVTSLCRTYQTPNIRIVVVHKVNLEHSASASRLLGPITSTSIAYCFISCRTIDSLPPNHRRPAEEGTRLAQILRHQANWA